MTKPAAASNGRELEVARAMFRDQVVFGPETPPVALQAARSAAFDPEHNALDAKILRFVVSNYGRNWQHDRPPHLWERGGGDAKLDELFAEEDGLFTEFQRLENEMWTAWDQLALTRQPNASTAAVPELTKRLDAAKKLWQKSKLELEACKGRRSDRAQLLQENYRRVQAGK